jgi:hypothetical protein
MGMFTSGKSGKGRAPQRGVHTDDAGGKVWCRICGRPVRSRLGAVCSSPKCQTRALAREEG